LDARGIEQSHLDGGGFDGRCFNGRCFNGRCLDGNVVSRRFGLSSAGARRLAVAVIDMARARRANSKRGRVR
jgi:hypothetical protein